MEYKGKEMKPSSDKVFTDYGFAKRIIDYFQPVGFCYDPCCGIGKDASGKPGGAFIKQFPDQENCNYSEIEAFRDCVDFDGKPDWTITNPPFSAKAYRKVSRHCFKISKNVVFLVRLDVALGTFARINDAKDNNMFLKEIIVCNYRDAGFADRGFTLGVFHWKKNYRGKTTWTWWNE